MTADIGSKAPAFTLAASGGLKIHSVALGNTYVLYFYPKANTTGCTKQAQSFQAALPDFRKKGAIVLGASRDPVAAQDKFAAKYGLEFPLLADEDGTLTESYGVWVEKSMYGKTYMGIERATFVIKNGIITHAWRKVKIPGHVAEVLAAV